MKWSLEEKAIASTLGAILLLLGWASLMSPKNTTELVDNANNVQSTYDILVDLTDFYAAMSIAESGRRGYVFFGREQELNRHRAAVLEMQAELEQLQQYTDLDPSQQRRIQQLDEFAVQRMVLFQQSIDLYQRDRSPSAMQTQNSITESSIQLREKIQVLLTEIKDTENRQLQESLQETQTNIEYRSSIERMGLLLIVVVACGVGIVFYWAQRRRQKLQMLEKSLAQEQELNHLKLQLFSMISHEFRTPLSVILASSQLLAEILEPGIEQGQLKNLYRIQASAKLMNQLLTDILTLTRAEAGNLDYQPEWTDVEAFCLNLLDDIQSLSSTHQTLHFTSQGSCGRAYLDEKLLYSTLSNLLLNAVKYSSQDSQVFLKLQCELGQVIFEVQDQGIGILQDDQENIFAPFYRGQNVENISGSGLGLAVVRKCLDLQNGSIHIESRAGSGTRFIISIPRQQADVSARPKTR